MKRQYLILLLLMLSLTSCWTHIWTVVPTEKTVTSQVIYTTQVTTPAPKHVTTTSMTVTSFNTDLCFYLDLQAVAAAFAESRNAQEFELLLNSNRYMINNLDLNGDGYIDYLRVLETHKGHYHAFLIQACIAPSLFQDVATLVAERRANMLYVDVVGDPYLYGYNYVVRPTFYNRPPMWDVFGRPNYVVWHSPYHYGHWPHHYQQTKPIYLSHYQAYISTYMTNHHYCHVCDYPKQVFYPDYHYMTQSHCRNDYGKQYPNKSFENRVTRQTSSHASNTPIRNAGELRTTTQPRNTQTTTNNKTSSSTTTRPSSTSASSSTSVSTRPTQTNATSTPVNVSNRTSSTTKVTSPSTSVETRVNKSGTTRTTVKTISPTTTQRVGPTSERTNTSTRNNTSTRVNSTNTSTRSTNAQPSRSTTVSSSTRR